jgi:hypothetical protein
MGRNVVVSEIEAAPGLRVVEIKATDWEAVQVYSFLFSCIFGVLQKLADVNGSV